MSKRVSLSGFVIAVSVTAVLGGFFIGWDFAVALATFGVAWVVYRIWGPGAGLGERDRPKGHS